MNRLEKILALLIVIALAVKFALIPLGNTLLILTLSALAILYYPLAFALFNSISFKQIFKKDSYKGTSVLRIIGSVGAGIIFSAVCIGILFKLQRWPESEYSLLVGLIGILIIFIVALIKYIGSRSVFYLKIIYRTFIIGGLGIGLFYLPEVTLVRFQYRNHPEYIKAYEQWNNNPEDKSIKRKLDIEYYRATLSEESFKKYMEYSERQNKNTSGKPGFVTYDSVINDISKSVSYNELRSKYNYEFIMLLDSSACGIIEKFNPEEVMEFRDNYQASAILTAGTGPVDNQHVNLIPIYEKSLPDCFTDKHTLNKILNSLKSDSPEKEIETPIYIKDHDKAVIRISGQGWSEVYLLTLTGNGITVVSCYSVIE